MRPRAEVEHCSLCNLVLPDEHTHLVEPATRRLICACDACALLFDGPNAVRYRRVPRRVRSLPDLRLTDEAWDALQLPINLAFFLRSTPAGRVVALYPSPAGATESLVAAEAWGTLEDANPALRDLQPDVEGLLVNRIGMTHDHYRVGIDHCYRLVGLIRLALARAFGRGAGLGRDRRLLRPAPGAVPCLTSTSRSRRPSRNASRPRQRCFSRSASPRPPPPEVESTPIHSVILRCQVRIEPARRSYSAAEKERLRDLFGSPERWGQTLRSMLWTQVNVVVPPFEGSTDVDLPIACSHDFNLAATRYFSALEGGDLPLWFLFSGTIFYGVRMRPSRSRRSPGRKRPITGSRPRTWREMMDHYYPNSAWLCLRQGRVRPARPVPERARPDDLGAGAGAAPGLGRGGGDVMNRALVDPIADAVLYEGYILYPYRPSTKNRQRWTFGGLYPEPYCRSSSGESWSQQTECLVLGEPSTTVEVVVRFLHLTARQVGAIDPPLAAWPDGREPPSRPVESLRVGDRLFQTWQEAEAREITFEPTALGELRAGPLRHPFGFPGGRRSEPLLGPNGEVVGVVIREQSAIEGIVELSAVEAGEGLDRLTLRVLNRSRLEIERRGEGKGTGSESSRCLSPFPVTSRDRALLRSMVSTHAILGVDRGEFVSLTDPPESCREAVAACRNVGVWPVLVGEEGRAAMMLSSPIILYDYPKIAPESAGDLFDGTEIDEILTLRIMTLTDEEKTAMAAVDERAGDLLARTEALAREQLMGLHGTFRGLRPSKEGIHG